MSLELKSQAPLTKADPVWYLISEAWIRSWREYVRGRKRRRRPGPIDNSFLLHSDGRPLDRLSPVRDYRGLQRDVWEKLHAMYGGGPAIVRRRIDIYGPALEEPGTSPTRNSARRDNNNLPELCGRPLVLLAFSKCLSFRHPCHNQG